MDTSHLVALHQGLSNEKQKLASATKPQEIALRGVWVKQLEKEIAMEEASLGMAPYASLQQLSGDDLLAELLG